MAVIAAPQAMGPPRVSWPRWWVRGPSPLPLQTDTGMADVTLRASRDAAGLVFSQTSCTVTTAPTQVEVHATAKSFLPGGHRDRCRLWRSSEHPRDSQSLRPPPRSIG